MKTRSKWITCKDRRGLLLRGIQQTRDGHTFRARIVRMVDGKQRQFTKHAHTKAEAKEKLKELETMYDKGGEELMDASRVTFRQLSKAYKEAHLNPPEYHVSDDGQAMQKISGCADYMDGRRAMRIFEGLFGHRTIRSINSNEIKQWKARRIKEPTERVKLDKDGKVKQRTWRDVHHTLHFLRHAFNYAIEEGWLEKNPASSRGVKGKLINTKLERERTRVLHDDEQVRLFKAVDDPFLKAVLTFLLYTGMRITEAEKIERGMIVRDNNTHGYIYLPAHITKDKKARDLPILTAELRDAITDRLSAIPSKKNALLFGDITNRCDDDFEKAVKAAQIEDFLMRDCRRTFVTQAIRVLPMGEVMKMTGHKVTKTLLRYLEPTAEAHRANVATFEAYMSAKQTQATIAVDQIN